MNPERWHRVRPILDRALELCGEERTSFLREHCGDDTTLRADVETLLRAEARGGLPLDMPVAEYADALVKELDNIALRAGGGAPGGGLGPVVNQSTSVLAGKLIGPWRIVRELGRGGMAVVYLAERADGAYKQQVALKLLPVGSPTADLVYRFERERQILASLEHPHIARLVDGGMTDGGQPWFAMEYVEGAQIDRFCDERRLRVEERLELFIEVARAVQTAHQALVVHRDLKPSNILVTADGDPRLLDFGIAKVLDPQPGATTLTHNLLMLTPHYASPEQVQGTPVTTASDVYQLGLLLYELLTGQRAQRVESRAAPALERTVLEQMPILPSVAAAAGEAATAESRRCTSPELVRRLRGDLDAIALKALRKEPTARYGSAEELAKDIERHRDGLPIEAHRPGRLYRAAKLVRRHRAGAAAAAIALISLLAGTGAATWQAGEARRERDRARAARAETEAALDRARAVSNVLAEILEASDPWGPAFRDTTTARALLDLGLARVDALEREPAVQAGLLDVLARVCASLGDLEKAEALARRSLTLRRRSLGEDHPELAASLNALGDIARRRGRYREADTLHREALDLQIRHLGPAHLEVAATLAQLARQLPRASAEAEKLYERSLTIRRASLGPEHPLVATSLMAVGRSRRSRGKPKEAEAAYRQALAIFRKAFGPEHPEVAKSMVFLADLMVMYGGETDRAESLYREALEIQRRALGENHPARLHALGSLSELLSERGQHTSAERLLREALDLRRAAFGPGHGAVAEGLGNLADELRRQGRLGEAERLLREALLIWRKTVGPDHWAVSGALIGLADVLVGQGKYEEAESLYFEALEIRRRAMGEEAVGLVLGSLGRLYALRGEYARADSVYHAALELFLHETTERNPDVRRLHGELAELYTAWGRDDEERKYRLLADSGARN